MLSSIGGAPYSPTSYKLIRLLLKGCANRPFFHVAVVEASKHMSAPIIEQLGSFDPLPNKNNEKLMVLNFRRLEYWLREGAQPTPPVQKLLGLCGYFPVHYESFQDAWKNRKLIKEHLENLQAEVANIEKNKSNELSKEAASNFLDMPEGSETAAKVVSSELTESSELVDPIEPKN